MRILGFVPLLVSLVGCVSSDVLHQRAAAHDLAESIRRADAVELFSLEPAEGIGSETGPFHGFEILGSVPLKKSEQSVLAEQLGDAIAASPSRMVACFNPRHGLRLNIGSEITDLVICFECATLYVHRPGSSPDRLNLEDTPEALINSWLDQAAVPRAAAQGRAG